MPATSRTVEWIGWDYFGDWGSLYRKWRFDKDVPALKATKGQRLLDYGPGYRGTKRFSIRNGDKKLGNPSPSAVAKHLFGGTLPPWDPPTVVDIAMLGAFNRMEEHLRVIHIAAVAAEITLRRAGEGRRAPDEAKPSEKRNKWLRFVREDEYRGGEPYTVWEFLQDAPGVPASGVNVKGPRHAVKGDELWEEQDEDGLTPFRLKRGGVRIGSPEWWQVRELFAGLRGDAKEEEYEGAAEDKLVDRYVSLVHPDTSEQVVLYARASVADTIIRAGDFLAFDRAYHTTPPRTRGATLHRVPRAQLRTVAAAVNRSLQAICGSPMQRAVFQKFLGRKPHPRARDETTPLVAIRPLVADVTQSIRAGSDDAALFELLSQVGGRMPSDG